MVTTTTASAVCSSLEMPKPRRIPRKRTGRPPKRQIDSHSTPRQTPLTAAERYWSAEECDLFEYLYSDVVDWSQRNASRQISQLMQERGFQRTETQVRTHVQKWRIKMAKREKFALASIPLVNTDFQPLELSHNSPAMQTELLEPSIEEYSTNPDQSVQSDRQPLMCSEENMEHSGAEHNPLEDLLSTGMGVPSE